MELYIHGKKSFTEVHKKIRLDANLKMIMLNHQNNYIIQAWW